MSKDLRRSSGIKAHKIACVVVDAMIVAGSDSAWDDRQEHIGRKSEAARLAGMQGGPVEERLLQARNAAIKRRERAGRIKQAVVQAVADLRLRLKFANSIKRLNVPCDQIAQDVQ